MRIMLSIATILGIGLASPSLAQPPFPPVRPKLPPKVPPPAYDPFRLPPNVVPPSGGNRDLSSSLSGTWYMGGDPNRPTQIIQRGGGRTMLVNENGDRAYGVVQGDAIVVPDWGDLQQPLQGRIIGDRINWANGTYWTAQPRGGFRW